MKNIFFILFITAHIFGYNQISSALSQIHFDFDSYELTPDSKSILSEDIKLMNETSKISITGFTDTIGTSEYNLILSKQRCNAVRDFLLSNGVKTEQIIDVIGKGEQQTHPTNAKNRMVEISTQTIVIVEPPVKISENIEPKIDSLKVNNSANNNVNTITTLEIGQTLALSNLSFFPGRHLLMPGSKETLIELVNILNENPNLKIEIQGHICCMSQDSDGLDKDTQTMNLSVNRAEYVYNYLINNGISPYRLTFKGFGASKPLVSEITEEDRQLNRRVEIMIVDK